MLIRSGILRYHLMPNWKVGIFTRWLGESDEVHFLIVPPRPGLHSLI